MADTRRAASRNIGEASVAYVLKGYPRISELFIASEIYRLEAAGFPVFEGDSFSCIPGATADNANGRP